MGQIIGARTDGPCLGTVWEAFFDLFLWPLYGAKTCTTFLHVFSDMQPREIGVCKNLCLPIKSHSAASLRINDFDLKVSIIALSRLECTLSPV